MPIDFRADQVQTSKIIVTGSTPQKQLLIYGIAADGSPVNQGNINTGVFDTSVIGADVFMYVSGGKNQRQDGNLSISAFGGDVVVSGAFYQGQPSQIKGGSYSHAEGDNTLAYADYSHAEGLETIALGSGSHSEGTETYAIGTGSHSEGTETYAIGTGSHSEGDNTLAYADYSHAEGGITLAYGQGSHSEGVGTQTYGTGSHAEGFFSIAYGDYSHAGGNFTIASGSYQTVFGSFNQRNNTTSLFVIGSGSSDTDRGDIFRAEPTGELVLSGGIVHNVRLVKGESNTPIQLTKQDYILIVDTTSQPTSSIVDVYLPLGSTDGIHIGQTYIIRKVDNKQSASSLTIASSDNSQYISGYDFSGGAGTHLGAQHISITLDSFKNWTSVTLTYVGDTPSTQLGDTDFSNKPTWFVTQVSSNLG
jgi:hypothetical protein